MRFPRCLTKMLRHTGGRIGHARRMAYQRITDDAGWATTGAICATAKGLKSHDKPAPKTINIDYMFGIVKDDDK
eukprot:8914536-Heterocapsa_arctica.AAC.1